MTSSGVSMRTTSHSPVSEQRSTVNRANQAAAAFHDAASHPCSASKLSPPILPYLPRAVSPQMYGLDLGFALTLAPVMGASAYDVSRFSRLETLQLCGFNPARASELGWRLVLPPSLRVLRMERLKATAFDVSLCTGCCFKAAIPAMTVRCAHVRQLHVVLPCGSKNKRQP